MKNRKQEHKTWEINIDKQDSCGVKCATDNTQLCITGSVWWEAIEAIEAIGALIYVRPWS